MDCRRFDVSPFWICRRFGVSPFWIQPKRRQTKTETCTILVCCRFGCRRFGCVVVLACRRFGRVAVLVVAILECRRFGLSPFWRVAVLDLSPFWLSPFWVCRRCGCRRFGFVAVLTCIHLDDAITSKVLKFAVDTKVFKKIKSDADEQQLQDGLNKMTEWFEKWQMLFNFGKCNCFHIGHGNEDAQCTMGTK